MRKRRIIQSVLVLLIFFLGACEKADQVNTIGETEYYFDEKLSSLSPGIDSTVWIGGETGEVWYVKDNERHAFEIGEDRIYKVVPHSLDPHRTICWIGVRNSGLQEWEMKEGRLLKLKTYVIPLKEDKYSPYDMAVIRDSIYVATSQGLYALSLTASPDSLQLLYPSLETLTLKNGSSFVVNNLFNYRERILFAATERGIVRLDLERREQQILHAERSADHVSVYNDTLFVLSGNLLYLSRLNGEPLQEIRLEFPARLYYQAHGIHYLIGTDHLLLSNDLQTFISVPLRRKIPAGCRNVVLPDPRNDFTLLLTESALWRIPYHLDIFNKDLSVKAACAGDEEFYYLTSRNELYRQEAFSQKASWVYSFPKEEQIVWMDVAGNDLYYYNSRQEVKKLSVSRHWMKNMLFHSPVALYQSKDKITATQLKKKNGGIQIYLGVQDGLIIADGVNLPDTVFEFRDKYVTSFFSPKHTDLLYLSTLNDGVFYVSSDTTFRQVPGTEKNSFTKDLIVTDDYHSSLITLTNHHMISHTPDDTLRVKGYRKLLYVNDTLFYALPEFGIRRFRVSGGRVREEEAYYTDISFNPAAAFAYGHRLYLGSNLGVLTIDAQRENASRWVAFRSNDVFSPRSTALAGGLILVLVVFTISGYVWRKKNIRKLILRQKVQLANRLEELASFYNLSDTAEREDLERLTSEIASIDPQTPGRKDTYALIGRLSNEIIRRNREATLRLLKRLREQIEWIEGTKAFERTMLLEDSMKSEKTNDIEQIRNQVNRNERWMKRFTDLENGLTSHAARLKDGVKIGGVNARLEEDFILLQENLGQKPLDELIEAFGRLKSAYEEIFSDKALTLILQHIGRVRSYLKEKTEVDNVSAGLLEQLDEAALHSGTEERLYLLRQLKRIENRVSLLRIKQEIASCIEEYQRQRNEIVRENERLINKKFDQELELFITSQTRGVVKRVDGLIASMYELLHVTDSLILNEVLKFSNAYHQQAKVLALLIADPKVKRSLIPGLLGIYGNLNPVISRLINNKIKPNEKVLKEYIRDNPAEAGFAYYVLNLAE